VYFNRSVSNAVTGRMGRRSWFLFVFLCIAWGTPYFFIKLALADLSPSAIVFWRIALGAVVICAIVPAADWKRLARRLPAIAFVGLIDLAIPFYFISAGERLISSSLTGLLIAAMPLVTALLALAVDRSERVTRWQLAGLVVGLTGVAVLLGLGTAHDRGTLRGVLMVAASTFMYAVGALAVRRWFGDLPVRAATAATLVVAAMALAPSTFASLPQHAPGVASIVAIVALGLLCTAAAYLAYFRLIADIGATRASVVTYVNPVVAVVLGVAFLHEPLTASMIAGFVLVILGSWLSTARARSVVISAGEVTSVSPPATRGR
jgi:drug/metabolite transporter (DMT)-like permease